MTPNAHVLCTAPMMDRNDSFSISIGCEAACAQRVHEGTAIDFACVRRNAIFWRSRAKQRQERTPPLVLVIMGGCRAAIGFTTETSIAKLAVRFFDVQRWTETPEGDHAHRLCEFRRRIFSRFEKLGAMFLGFLRFVLVADGLRGLC